MSACYSTNELEWVDANGASLGSADSAPAAAQQLRTIASQVMVMQRIDDNNPDMKPAVPDALPDVCDHLVARWCERTGRAGRAPIRPNPGYAEDCGVFGYM